MTSWRSRARTVGRLAVALGATLGIFGCPGEIHFASEDAGEVGVVPGGPCAREADCPAPLHCDVAAGTCVRCAVDGQCSGATPRCDPAANVCVECIAAADCTEADTTCDTLTHLCRPTCSATIACPSAVPVCDEARGLCIGCVHDDQCVGRGERARCLSSRGECVECLSSADCKAPGRPTCDVPTSTCVK